MELDKFLNKTDIQLYRGILHKIYKDFDNMEPSVLGDLLDKLKDSEEYDKIFNDFHSSPLWTRKIGNMGLKEEHDKDSCNDLLKPLEKNYKVKNIYVGHTPLLDKGISSICDNKVWLTDYGSSKAFDIFSPKDKIKEVQVLEILNDNEFNVLK